MADITLSGYKILNHRISLIWILALAVLLWGCNPEKPKVYRVGVLAGFIPYFSLVNEFKAGMEELGYVEGENIFYDIQKVNVDPLDERRAIEKFVADKVDLIFVFPTAATVTAKVASQGSNIPVVFAMAGLEGNNLVESVRRPGEYITGVRYPGPDITLKRLEFLQMLTPNLKRLYITYNPEYPANKISLSALRPTVSAIGVSLVEVPVTSVEDIRADLQARTDTSDIGMDAIMIMPDDISQSSAGSRLIRQFAVRHKVPVAGAAAICDLGPSPSSHRGRPALGHRTAGPTRSPVYRRLSNEPRVHRAAVHRSAGQEDARWCDRHADPRGTGHPKDRQYQGVTCRVACCWSNQF